METVHSFFVSVLRAHLNLNQIRILLESELILLISRKFQNSLKIGMVSYFIKLARKRLLALSLSRVLFGYWSILSLQGSGSVFGLFLEPVGQKVLNTLDLDQQH